MNKESHLLHYLILLLGLAVFVFLFVFFKHNTNYQLVVSGGASIFYILWGIVHHAIEGRLTKLIAMEYVLIGSFVFLVILTALSL